MKKNFNDTVDGKDGKHPGVTPIYGIKRYVPRYRVWFLRFSVLK